MRGCGSVALKRPQSAFPTKEKIRDYVRNETAGIGKREIARAFNIRGDDRATLNKILRELLASGELDRGRGKRFGTPGSLPKVTVIEVTGISPDGDPIARPARWDGNGDVPIIYLTPNDHGVAPGVGDRILARLTPQNDGSYSARTIKKLDATHKKLLGIFRTEGRAGRVLPTNRKIRAEYFIERGDENGAAAGDLVEATLTGGRSFGLPKGKISRVIGPAEGGRAASLIATYTHDIPTEFSKIALADAHAVEPISTVGRTDLREMPFVTIDGQDARDFDDAVWAEPHDDGDTSNGWHLVVAIADVAHYVRPETPLDKEAYKRGNSVYFPDRVIPMLPENISNGLCSLVPGEDRGCLAVHLWIDAKGELLRHEFVRGIMRSVARLTYEQVQQAIDGMSDNDTAPIKKDIIDPLYGAYLALEQARAKRGAIDLDLPERRIKLDRAGNVLEIEPTKRLDSHRLIEEFMINANVAAALTLEKMRSPCMFRVHDHPSNEKIESLREALASLAIKIPKSHLIRPKLFQNIVNKYRDTPESHFVSTTILRSQAQAEYHPENIGHFGLALRRYAHFTSPIRRYSDLLVHRALIGTLKYGDDGLKPEDRDSFLEYGRHISSTERRAIAAERETNDRLTAIYLADKVGGTFKATISGVHRAGAFITLHETGADGLVPMSMLSPSRLDLDTRKGIITGRTSDVKYAVGDPITVRLEEASITTGSLVFSAPDQNHNHKARRARGKSKRGKKRPRSSKISPTKHHS